MKCVIHGMRTSGGVFLPLIMLLALLLAACAPVAAAVDTPSVPTRTPGSVPPPTVTESAPTDPANGLPPEAVLDAQRWLADRLGVPIEQVAIAQMEQAEWPDACLGLASTGEACAEVISPGWRVQFEVDGTLYEVRTDATGDTVRLAAGEAEAPLAGTVWRLEAMELPDSQVTVVPTSTVTLVFEAGGQVSGSGGCNQFGGQYTVDGDSLSINELVQTERACLDEALMQQEQQYLETLQNTNTYTLEGERLTLTTGAGTLIFGLEATGTPEEPEAARVPGILEFGEEGTQDVLTLPDRIVAGEEFEVTVTTFGSGCEQAGDAAAVVTTDGAAIFVYDLTQATTPGVVCTAILKRLPHVVTLRFDETGEKVLWVWGRRAGPGTTPLGEPVVIEQRVTVEE